MGAITNSRDYIKSYEYNKTNIVATLGTGEKIVKEATEKNVSEIKENLEKNLNSLYARENFLKNRVDNTNLLYTTTTLAGLISAFSTIACVGASSFTPAIISLGVTGLSIKWAITLNKRSIQYKETLQKFEEKKDIAETIENLESIKKDLESIKSISDALKVDSSTLIISEDILKEKENPKVMTYKISKK